MREVEDGKPLIPPDALTSSRLPCFWPGQSFGFRGYNSDGEINSSDVHHNVCPNTVCCLRSGHGESYHIQWLREENEILNSDALVKHTWWFINAHLKAEGTDDASAHRVVTNLQRFTVSPEANVPESD